MYGPVHTVEVAATPDGYRSVQFANSEVYPINGAWSGYLSSYVKENGCNRALLWFNKRTDSNAYLQGYWSPDSV